MLRGCEVSDFEGGTVYVLADYGQFTVFAHQANDVPFAREFAKAWGGKQGRVVELTQADLHREYAEEEERLKAT